jgi:uncharacterized protein YqeY
MPAPSAGQGRAEKRYLNVFNGLLAVAVVAAGAAARYVRGLRRKTEDGTPMQLRDRIAAELKAAMKNREETRLATLRLINAALKDREIALRGAGEEGGAGLTDEEVRAILAKMVKQRQESARAYEEGGRLDLAERERDEIAVIEEFLPRQLSDEEIRRAVEEAITETDAKSIRDMGRVMGALKKRYTGQMDFGRVGGMVKERLA